MILLFKCIVSYFLHWSNRSACEAKKIFTFNVNGIILLFFIFINNDDIIEMVDATH